ncbi:hypothetical protein [Janibacter terrae]|uniref:hypothetical protein n=1 Tax=Janibacter terrae TaxID=103817 RepID=UPI00082EAA99|nr:hypothetical protein [Janibacter terrae]
MTSSRELHDALVRALEPVTRWRHPAPGDGPPVRVNEVGLDVWENHVGDARIDPDGTAHAYLFLQTSPGGRNHTRAVAATTLTRWRPILTFAGGTPAKTRWGIDHARPLLDGLTLTTVDGRELTAPLHEGFTAFDDYDPGPLRLDQDPSPPRWYVPIQYATQAS